MNRTCASLSKRGRTCAAGRETQSGALRRVSTAVLVLFGEVLQVCTELYNVHRMCVTNLAGSGISPRRLVVGVDVHVGPDVLIVSTCARAYAPGRLLAIAAHRLVRLRAQDGEGFKVFADAVPPVPGVFTSAGAGLLGESKAVEWCEEAVLALHARDWLLLYCAGVEVLALVRNRGRPLEEGASGLGAVCYEGPWERAAYEALKPDILRQAAGPLADAPAHNNASDKPERVAWHQGTHCEKARQSRKATADWLSMYVSVIADT